MPILPIMDLLIVIGWTLVSVGAVLKAIYVTTSYRPTLLGLGPLDCAIAAGVFLLFALALAARAWVKSAEQEALAARRLLPRHRRLVLVGRERAQRHLQLLGLDAHDPCVPRTGISLVSASA